MAKSIHLRKFTYFYVLIPVAIYFIYVLSQFRFYAFSMDDCYYLGRAERALFNPLSIFWPDYASRFHPLYLLFASLEYRIFGLEPVAYGVIQVATHILNCFLLFWLLRLINLPRTASLFCALFSLFFSSQITVIFSIASLTRLAGFSFYLLSFIYFLKFLNSKRLNCYVYAFIFFIFALGFMEDVVMLPALLLMATSLFYKNGKSFIKQLLYILPFCLMSLSYLTLSFICGGVYRGIKYNHLKIGLHIGREYMILCKEFIHMLFIPRPEFVSNFTGFAFFLRIAPILFIIVYFILFLKAGRLALNKNFSFGNRPKILIFAILWIIVASFPYTLTPYTEAWPNAHLYIPAFGLAILCGILAEGSWRTLRQLRNKISKPRLYLLKAGFLLILVYILTLNMSRNIFMYHKIMYETIHKEAARAKKEEFPIIFKFVNSLRLRYPIFPERTVLVIKGLPFEDIRLHQLLREYYFPECEKIFTSKEAKNLKFSPYQQVIYLKWKNYQLVE